MITTVKQSDGRLKGYRIICGSVLKDGERKPRLFHLGKDMNTAELIALKIRQQWRAVLARSQSDTAVWPDSKLDEIQQWISGDEVPLSADEKKRTKLKEVMEKWLEDMRERYTDGAITYRSWYNYAIIIKRMQREVGDVSNAAMGDINDVVLERIARAIKKGDKVKDVLTKDLRVIKSVLQFAISHEYWQPTNSYICGAHNFRLLRGESIKMLRKRTAKRKHFTTDELRTMWTAIGEMPSRIQTRLKALLLLGINCGFLFSESSQLKWSEIVESDGSYYIEKPRPKTGVMGKHKLWPETVDALKAIRVTDVDSVFTTNKGRAIWRMQLRGRVVAAVWSRMLWKYLKQRGTPMPIPWKCLRKTASQKVREFKGHEACEAFLCHSEGSISEAYSEKLYDIQHEATDLVRKWLLDIIRV